MTYFVDSVDKTATPVDHVLAELQNELRTADLFRLHLRLVCRDFDWSVSFAAALRSLWGENADGAAKVQVLQLAPLSLKDIRKAARRNGQDPDKFLQDLEAADASALAAIPITLEMLLRTGELTSNRLELYERGIRRLCRQAVERDVSEKRLTERVCTASSMAAVMLLGDKYKVDIESESIGESILSVRDLLQDADSEEDEKLVRETLNTGLFQGARERAWSHQSFAEYLAAVYLSLPEITVKEIVKFTTNGNGVFATQLYEVLRWLIEMRPDVLNEIVERQPALLLTTDLSHLDDKDFRHVYKAMLSLDDPYIYSSKTWELKKFRATHPSAGRVLLPYLQDNEGNVYRRRFALDLLKCHGYPDMEDTLVGLALNEYEDVVLRRLAARGIREVGSVETKLELKPYVSGRQDDPDDEIKGYALQALWPEQLTAEELFEALCLPRLENFYGSYKSFLIDESFLGKIKPNDWPVALKWVVAQPSRHEMPFSLQDLPGKIMRKSWEDRRTPGVLEAFAKTVITTTLVRLDGVFGRRPNMYPPDIELDEFEKAFVQESQYRRELALMCLPYLVASDKEAWRLAHTWPPIVVPEDLDWLLGLLQSATDEVRRGQLVALVARLTPYGIEKVYEARERHHDLKQLTKHYFVSDLGDPNVISEREHFHKIREIDEQIESQRAKVQPVEVIMTALDGLESGEAGQWQNVLYGLQLDPRNSTGAGQINPDATDWVNWAICDEETQCRIVRAARYYVLNQDEIQDNEEHWFDTTSYPWIEWNGYLALQVLLARDLDAIQELPAERWERWSKVIVRFPLVVNSERHLELVRERQQALLRMLNYRAPQTFINDIRRLLVAEDRRDASLYGTVEKIDLLWDAKLEATLMDMLRSERLSAKGQRSLLDILLKHNSDGAVKFAEEIIGTSYSNEVEKERLVELCAGLMLSQLEFNWQAVWKEMRNDENVGKAIVEKVAEDDRNALKFSEHLSALELADLFIWAETQYPSHGDPQIDGFHTVGTREQVGQWRNNLITQLRAKNSQDAQVGIRRILDRFPELEWIQFVRVELEETVEELDWKPAKPSEILDLTVVKETRLQVVKRKSIDFMKKNGKWLIGIAAKYLPTLFGSG